MFDTTIPKYERQLEAELEHSLVCLHKDGPDSATYAKTLTSVERLHTLLNHKKTAEPLSRDTLATIGANLFGILLILKHEDVNVITSKALGFIMRIK